MNIHEFQARELFAEFGVATQPGSVAHTVEEAKYVAASLGGKLVIKAQIHAGGRGKGTFKSGFRGGVHLCDTPEQAKEMIAKGKRMALRHGFGTAGAKLVTLAGVPFGTPGATNLLHVVTLAGNELEKYKGEAD